MKLRKAIAALGLAAMMTTLFAGNVFAGWVSDGGWWWYRDSDGSYPANGMYEIDGDLYIFDINGYLVEDRWIQLSSGKWFYCNDGGVVARNQWVGDYYVGNYGEMLTDTYTPDGYYVGADGRWVNNREQSGGEYYTIEGQFDNRNQSGFSDSNRVDAWVHLVADDPYMAKIEFGLTNPTASGSSGLYDKKNPSGDNLSIATVDGYNWGGRSEISGTWYEVEYDGKDTITIHWKEVTWNYSKKIVLRRRSGGRLFRAGTGSVG